MQRQIHIGLQSSCTSRTSQAKMLTLWMLSWLTRWLLGLLAIACTSSGSNSMVCDIMTVAYAASGMVMMQGRGGRGGGGKGPTCRLVFPPKAVLVLLLSLLVAQLCMIGSNVSFLLGFCRCLNCLARCLCSAPLLGLQESTTHCMLLLMCDSANSSKLWDLCSLVSLNS